MTAEASAKLYADSSTTIDNEIGVTIPKNGHASAKARNRRKMVFGFMLNMKVKMVGFLLLKMDRVLIYL